MSEDTVKIFGRYIVADPRICHGQLTFRGTRVLVDIVLAQVARVWTGKPLSRTGEAKSPRRRSKRPSS